MLEAEINPNVVVTSATQYIEDQSDPEQNRYVFAYTVTINNQGDMPVQLKSRYWLITDSNGKKTQVEGDGVIGQQPTIKPGRQFQYTSGAVVETPVATMEGFYVMATKDPVTTFNAPISVFRLALPNILN